MRRPSRWIWYLLLLLMTLIITIPHHLGYSLGDRILWNMGLSPWTKGNNNGIYLPSVIGIILVIFILIRTVANYRSHYPKMLRWLIVACLLWIWIYPHATEKFSFLIKHDAEGLHSLDYNVKDGSCSYYNTEDRFITATCAFTLYNYGNEKEIAIKPIFPNRIMHVEELSDFQFDFEPNTVQLVPHQRMRVGVMFKSTSRLPDDYGSLSGTFLEGVGAEITTTGRDTMSNEG